MIKNHLWKGDIAMSQLKKRSREGLGLGGLLWKNFGFANLRSANFSSADLRSANFRFAKFGARMITLAAISLSLTLAGCDSGGGGGGGGSSGSNGDKPSCTGSEILKDGSCEACPDPQFPNADRTACVTKCPDGEIQLANNPTCEIQVTCTGRQIFNPTDNSCFELSCDEGKIPDTTAVPPVCISESDCRTSPGKLLSADGRSCISESGCLAVSNQLINERGDCEACTGDVPVRNVEKNACISEAACQGTSVGPNSLLGTDCVTDETCQNMAGHVATTDGECQECSGENNVRSVDKTECITATDCHKNLSTNPNSILGDDCITDAACQNMPSHVAQHDGVCQECEGDTPTPNLATGMCDADSDSDGVFDSDDNCPALANADQTNTDGDSQGDACDMNDDGDSVADVDDAFPLDACASVDNDNDGAPDALVSSCDTTLSADNCLDLANAEQTDTDGDGQGDACDSCPAGAMGLATGADNAATADPDGDGCKNSEDAFSMDACASLDTDSDNMPDDLLADCTSSLTEDDDDDNDGVADAMDACPAGSLNAASGADTATTADPDSDGCKNSEDVDDDNDGLIELASYAELQNMRHDLAGHSYNDGDTASTAGAPEEATDNCSEETSAGSGIFLCGYELAANIDANASCPNYDGSNGDDLRTGGGSNADDCGAGQEAWAPVGDNSNRFTGILEGNGHSISNLYYQGNTRHNGLFGYTSGAVIQNLSLDNVYINSSNINAVVGGIAGRMRGGSIIGSHVTGSLTGRITGGLMGSNNNVTISNSYSTGSVNGNTVGGLVGDTTGSSNVTINNSYSTGSVNGNIAGGLVGIASNVDISNSYATGSVDSGTAGGGLVGGASNVDISNSYATSNVTSTANGFFGGLVGQLAGSSITNSYATGNAKTSADTSNAGGLVGNMSSSIISNSYAAGGVSTTSTAATAITGAFIGTFAGHIFGKNYYVDTDGMNGIGSGTCDSAICIRAGAAGNTDAQRRTWLQTTADESTVGIFPTDTTGNDHDGDNTTPNITWEVWESSIWGSFTSGYPCLKNMPAGARVCN